MIMHFYDDAGIIYPTHIDAIRSFKKCKFYYNDAFYDSLDWKTPSALSLDELYKLRAEEIRSKYDYVVLCLSGGVDSRNVLESFLKNNILIDEILCVGAYSQDEYSGSTENNNDEIFYNVKPLLNKLSLPNTKITYFDYSTLFDDIKNFSLLTAFGNDWSYKLPFFKSFHHFFWYDLNKHLNISDSKKACYVMGTGKTLLNLQNSKPYVNFRESDVMDYGARYQIGNLYRENFYFGNTPISGEIVKKQAHILWELYNTSNKEQFFKDYFTFYPKILYNLQNPLIRPTRKSTMPFLSHRDGFMKRKANSEIYKIWYEGVYKISNDISLSYQTHYSKPYYIL